MPPGEGSGGCSVPYTSTVGHKEGGVGWVRRNRASYRGGLQDTRYSIVQQHRRCSHVG